MLVDGCIAEFVLSCIRFFPFTEFTLSGVRFFATLRMTGSEGFRASAHTLRMTTSGGVVRGFSLVHDPKGSHYEMGKSEGRDKPRPYEAREILSTKYEMLNNIEAQNLNDQNTRVLNLEY